MTDLEREARDLYGIVVAAMKPDTPRYTAVGEEIAEFHFVQGYLAAAAPRDEEIDKLRSRLARYDEAVRLLRECGLYTDNSDFDNKVIAFLTAEPKEGEGGR